MLLALSALLVFGAVAVFVGDAALSEHGRLGFGYQQMIHARIPWLLLGALLGGATLGVVSLLRSRRWYEWTIVSVEVVFAALLTWYFMSFSFLPQHRVAVAPGDPFPAYALVDQDGQLHEVAAGAARRPALYVFYRGDW